jgi:hypothetical protein
VPDVLPALRVPRDHPGSWSGGRAHGLSGRLHGCVLANAEKGHGGDRGRGDEEERADDDVR